MPFFVVEPDGVRFTIPVNLSNIPVFAHLLPRY